MITWREKMTIDDGGPIDQDHRHLVEIINHFQKIARDGLDSGEAAEILYALKFYSQTHFKREERLQILIGFPYADAHQQEHENLTKKLDSAIQHFQECSGGLKETIQPEISEMLHDWLINHILSSDLKMRPYVDAMKKHGHEFGPLKEIDVYNP